MGLQEYLAHKELTARPFCKIGSIGFNKLKIFCIIGVEKHEREEPQEIYVDLKVSYDLSACVEDDRMAEAIDYVSLARACSSIAKEGRFQLIETYAWSVLQHLRTHFPITHAWIRVEKPKAIERAACSFVEVEV